VHRNNILICIQQDTNLHSLFFWKLLYMFRVVLSPIIRSSNDYLQHLLLVMPLLLPAAIVEELELVWVLSPAYTHKHTQPCAHYSIEINNINSKNLDDWQTVQHRSITLCDLHLDAQNSHLFIYNIFNKILYIFLALPCSSSGASGIVTFCRWLSCAPVHKTVTCRQWRYQRLHIYNYDVDLLKMSRSMLETCRRF
jgi:hypothetical protein